MGSQRRERAAGANQRRKNNELHSIENLLCCCSERGYGLCCELSIEFKIWFLLLRCVVVGLVAPGEKMWPQNLTPSRFVAT